MDDEWRSASRFGGAVRQDNEDDTYWTQSTTFAKDLNQVLTYNLKDYYY